MTNILRAAFILLIALAVTPASADDSELRSRFDQEAVQGLLAVQRLDGWLLYDSKGTNPIATELVNPAGTTSRGWYYLIPADGQPTALVHKSEMSLFDKVPGTKIEYNGYRDLKDGLAKMLKGVKAVGMEYAPKSGIPSLTRVDAATIDLVKAQGVKIESSSGLVQFTKSLWGPDGRVSHYVTAHHLTKLRASALGFIRDQLAAGKPVTEYSVQKHIIEGYKIRGIDGPVPIVAVNENTADPNYTPSAKSSSTIKDGDFVLLNLRAKLDTADRAIFADVTWVAYVGATVPDRYKKVFDIVAQARDAAIDHIRDRTERRRAVKGYEPDQKARNVIATAGYGDNFVHRTGHSLDSALEGDGANLDDYETHDTRNLVMGSGFTVEPGVYIKGDFGVRAGLNVFIGRDGVELTIPAQTEITAILAR
jgi:Xaa-Pro aminopeptidase